LIPTFIKYREVAAAKGYLRQVGERGRRGEWGKKTKQEAARLNWTKTRLSRKYPYPTVLSY